MPHKGPKGHIFTPAYITKILIHSYIVFTITKYDLKKQKKHISLYYLIQLATLFASYIYIHVLKYNEQRVVLKRWDYKKATHKLLYLLTLPDDIFTNVLTTLA